MLGGTSALIGEVRRAFGFLMAELDMDGALGSGDALERAGRLAGRYCDGPVQIGGYASSSGFVVTILPGLRLSSSALRTALEAVDSAEWTETAVTASERLEAFAGQDRMDWGNLKRVLEGASGRFDHKHVAVDGAVRLLELSAFAELAKESMPHARAYLRGAAAHCAFALGATLNGRVGFSGEDHMRPRARALTRLEWPFSSQPLTEPSDAFRRNASVVTLQQLVAEPTGDAREDCATLAEELFPDTHDSMLFDLAVPNGLYERMERVVEDVRAALRRVLARSLQARAVLYQPDAMGVGVDATRLRIPGAPRGSWAGATRPLPQATLSVDDGIFVMALKQARAVFLDRINLAFGDAQVCESVLASGALDANAWIIPSMRCSYYLLGMAVPPFAGSIMDNASLYARFGWVVAHELAHTSLNAGYSAQESDATLARRYAPATRGESIADVLAAMAILETGAVQARELCAQQSQMWCARTPPLSRHGRGNQTPEG